MKRNALADKIIVLGVDGMDPRLARKYVDEGLMPNLQRYLEQGSAREDLVLLGAMPTITPPMWTTLATGAYPATHGITCFYGQHPTKIDTFVYNDSTKCKAEPIWNVFAEAGKKTLVWHWPGSSWPPTSTSPNLHVVEGTQPTAINYGAGGYDRGYLYFFDDEYTATKEFTDNGVKISGVGCIVDDVEVRENGADCFAALAMPEPVSISMNAGEGDCHGHGKPPFHTESPFREAKNWPNAKEGDKEFEYFVSDQKIRRVGLFRKNEDGIYDTIEIYKNKKDSKPLVTLKNYEYVTSVIDERYDSHEEKGPATSSYFAFDMDESGKGFKLWIGNAIKLDFDAFFDPKDLYQEVIDYCGQIPSVEVGLNLGLDPHLVKEIMNRSWRYYGDWQAKAMNHLLEKENYDVVISHYHNVDNFGHIAWEYHNAPNDATLDAAYEDIFQQVYIDTDRYLGEFLHLLDEGWTVIITSDHGLICKEDLGLPPGIGDGFVVNTEVMRELGYTVMKRDADGKELREIDYSKTRAVASRANHIFLNMKGRYEYGIVDESEKYDLEQQIINDLYNYRFNGKRVITLAIRNRDAALFGLNGDRSGDILYWVEEDFCRVHGESLSTAQGHADTSVSPIFIAAGKGIKHNFYTDRVIRQVDVAPTLAILGGIRMPAQCEGAPAYQIFDEEI